MRTRILAVAAAAAMIAAAGTAHADEHGGHGDGAAPAGGGNKTPALNSTKGEQAVFFTAELSGAEEVPVEDGPSVGDPEGHGRAIISVKGDRVTFALDWEGTQAPTLGHIHQGAAGENGDVRLTFFDTALPETVTAVAGQTTITDEDLALRLLTDPAGFYVNLHTEEFPGGAVRGQLTPSGQRLNVLGIIEGSGLVAVADGAQEVFTEEKPQVGDPDGRASGFFRPEGDTVAFSTAWTNVAPPTIGHLHRGVAGENGDVAVELFAGELPATVFAVSGTVAHVDPAVTERISAAPHDYYLNLHTGEFPDGAVRGQLF
ncbi:CHRD domain-containing protein [Nocardiopsis sp. CC223A]|uniref:CHRD domain-containing protein n=1 Tax=Nocardiopsis sp. CC223A TaxID=3044051 RepID=UPI00278C43CC|nr:CHRD domain-containing protein [Nocardiopsis sp. CC223A]